MHMAARMMKLLTLPHKQLFKSMTEEPLHLDVAADWLRQGCAPVG
jgi:hypothetical protein